MKNKKSIVAVDDSGIILKMLEKLLGGATYASGEQSVYVDYVKVTPDNVGDFMK